MDFSETEDQIMIRDMVRDFAETVASPTCHQRDKEQKPPIDAVSYTHLTLPTICSV